MNDRFLSLYGPDVPAPFSGPLSEVKNMRVLFSNPKSLTEEKEKQNKRKKQRKIGR